MTTDLPDLTVLQARAAIEDVFQRYARAVDARDAARLRSCFTADARASYAGRPELPDAESVVAWLLDAVGRFECTQHLNGVSEIQVDGDEAQATTPIQAAHVRGEAEGILFLGGLYSDRLRRVGGEWLIAERRFDVIWRHDTGTGESGDPA